MPPSLPSSGKSPQQDATGHKLVLFCKSYAGDLKRVHRLLRSVERFNKDQLQMFVSIPECDFRLFHSLKHTTNPKVRIIADEMIALSNPRIKIDTFASWDGRLSQQVIKSEFWRWWLQQNPGNGHLNYVCIDSESEFLRDFFLEDFVDSENIPYTVCHDHRELLSLASWKKKRKVLLNFQRDCEQMKVVFKRSGPNYAFSPTPVIWSSKVWNDLDSYFLQPLGMTIWDAIRQHPNELHWYGEALLKFRSIPLHPIGPLFRVYHYDWEYFSRLKMGETNETIQQRFLGVLKQSNWDFDMDQGKHAFRKRPISRLFRRLRRLKQSIFS